MHGSRRGALTALIASLALAVGAPPLAAATRHVHHASVPSAPAADDPSTAADASFSDLTATALPADDASAQAPGVIGLLADWAASSGDADHGPFLVVDKLGAEVFVFDAAGALVGHAPVLVGIARGDDSMAGVGDMRMGAIPMDQRTTPAGRFVATYGPSAGEGTVLWVDYADAIGMHPVITSNPSEHRLQRIASASPDDHRISHGCINVPAKFYANVIQTAFAHGGVVYVLPDTKTLAEVFPAFAAATFAGPGEAPPRDHCAEPLAALHDGIPDPDPSALCRADEGERSETAAR